MNNALKYMPIFRGRQQEILTLKSFKFSDRIFPCIEIIKEIDRLASTPRKNAKNPPKPAKGKKFEDVYIPLIKSINSEKVFVDLPVHLKDSSKMKPETLHFLRTVVGNRGVRTTYMLKLNSLSDKVIPVISTYHNRTGERGSIKLQEADLRPYFNILAYRTFPETFSRDIAQIESIVRSTDYLIMDWAETQLDATDPDQQEIIEKLEEMECTIIVHRNPFPKGITNVGLSHCNVVSQIDNSLIATYEDYSGNCFSDYAGIKKDDISKGGAVSPGFVYYDAVNNEFYGYKGSRKELSEFEVTIVPAILKSPSSRRMNTHSLDFLGAENTGWKTLNNIHRGLEPGRSAAKFKKIGMDHYLHCIKVKIANGDFD